MLFMHAPRRADSRTEPNTGKVMAARIAMMAITTSISIIVKAAARCEVRRQRWRGVMNESSAACFNPQRVCCALLVQSVLTQDGAVRLHTGGAGATAHYTCCCLD
jgi:hypothetical protein